MQTRKEPFLALLGAPGTRYVIPAYQRLYSWKRRQCRELWLDLHRAARAKAPHFIGTLLYAQESDDELGFHRRSVIDGQQRLTTLTLVLVALADYLATHETVLPDIDAQEIERRYLRVSTEPSGPARLVLSRDDRAALFDVIEGKALDQTAPEAIRDNLAFFKELMGEEDFDATLLWSGIQQLFVITALVDASDNAQLIFESLNSKGMPLTTADLVRNYLLLAETHQEQTRLFDEYWDPIQGMFQPDPGSLRLDNAIQGWLSVRFRKVRARGAGEVYSVFKQYVEDEFTGSTEGLLEELRRFCLVWAENYRYHAVKKYKSACSWATNGPGTLVANRTARQADNAGYAEGVRQKMDATDASL